MLMRSTWPGMPITAGTSNASIPTINNTVATDRRAGRNIGTTTRHRTCQRPAPAASAASSSAGSSVRIAGDSMSTEVGT